MGAVQTRIPEFIGTSLQIAELIEDEQLMIARAAEVAVVGCSFLIVVGRAKWGVSSVDAIYSGAATRTARRTRLSCRTAVRSNLATLSSTSSAAAYISSPAIVNT